MDREATAQVEPAGSEQERKPSDGEALANSRPFDLHKTSEYEAVDRFVDELFLEIPYDHRRPKGANEEKAKQRLKTVLMNLFDVYHVDPDRWIGYSRTPAWYSKIPARYNKLDIKCKGLLRIVDGLQKLGYIDHKLGFRAQTTYAQGRLSRMRARPELIGLMNQAGIEPYMAEKLDDEETIILRARKEEGEQKGKEIDYEDIADTVRMRENVRGINFWLQEHWIDIYVSDQELEQINNELKRKKDALPFEPKRKRLRRIFNNGSFKQGGRFYGGWWQEIPKRWRTFIMIDNRATCEIDYSGMHLRMLYAREGFPMPEEDPYMLPGCSSDVRDFLKASLNTIINADSRPTAISAIKRDQDISIIPPEYPDVESLIDAFTKKHEPIRHLFYSGLGVDLQYIDSQIAELIMLELGKDGIVALPVHDSFIVEQRHEDRLRDAMYHAFEAINDTGTDIKMNPRLGDLVLEDGRLEKLNSRDMTRIHEYSGYHRREREFTRELVRRAKKNNPAQ